MFSLRSDVCPYNFYCNNFPLLTQLVLGLSIAWILIRLVIGNPTSLVYMLTLYYVMGAVATWILLLGGPRVR